MSPVEQFERAFAEYVGARHAIALCNGTATLHTALASLGVDRKWEADDWYRKQRVAVPPLTMSATTIAVLHAGAEPVFMDVDPQTWLANGALPPVEIAASIPVSLYGLHQSFWSIRGAPLIDDAAQTLRPHGPGAAFTSYSFQASKILPLGEGGMLTTNDPELAVRAREVSSLGYQLGNGPTIDKRALKDPGYARHHSLGWNYRMSALVAQVGYGFIRDRQRVKRELRARREAAALYRDAIDGCPWITPQHVPDGWTHDYWSFAVALEHADLWRPFADAIERHGGTRPFAAWRLTYQEPAFRHLAEDGCCPVAEDLQPRICAFQTNDLESAKRNAHAVDAAIYELNGVPA